MSLTGSHILVTGPQLLVLFGKVRDTLGGAALFEEAHHKEKALSFMAFLNSLLALSFPMGR